MYRKRELETNITITDKDWLNKIKAGHKLTAQHGGNLNGRWQHDILKTHLSPQNTMTHLGFAGGGVVLGGILLISSGPGQNFKVK